MALQMVSAMQPFAQAGIVDLPKLAEYVLGTGFGVKNPQAFLTTPPPQAMEGQGGQPMGPGGPEGMPPGMPPAGQISGPGPQVPASPQEMALAPEELITIIQGLESGELTPEEVPPEILAQIEQFLAEQGGQQAPAQGEMPEQLALILQGLQSGELQPQDVPPEILAQLEQQMQGM